MSVGHFVLTGTRAKVVECWGDPACTWSVPNDTNATAARLAHLEVYAASRKAAKRAKRRSR